MSATQESVVAWNDSFALELPEIDDQHKVLFDIMNKLWNAIVMRAGKDEMLAIVGALEEYTVEHFTAEEAFMRAMNYPSFEAHKALHTKFIERIAEEKMRVIDGKQLDLTMLHFLKDWLINHILVMDRAYAEQYRAAEQMAANGGLGRFFRRLLWG